MSRERKDINRQIGKRLQDVRENSGYTQERFAEVLDVGVEHYRKLESGLHGLQPEKMLVLYRTFKIDPTYLITGDKNQQSDDEMFLANCSRLQRDEFIERVLVYMKNLMLNSK
ncbi:MAG: helix-turn-helix domain-containing protein [Suipraeoptans sp.]